MHLIHRWVCYFIYVGFLIILLLKFMCVNSQAFACLTKLYTYTIVYLRESLLVPKYLSNVNFGVVWRSVNTTHLRLWYWSLVLIHRKTSTIELLWRWRALTISENALKIVLTIFCDVRRTSTLRSQETKQFVFSDHRRSFPSAACWKNLLERESVESGNFGSLYFKQSKLHWNDQH